MNKYKISLQINVSATDLNICRKMLERQLSFWYGELEEIVISIESKKSFGKFAKDFDKNKDDLIALINHYTTIYPKLRYHYIDYSPERNRVLSDLFFNTNRTPEKDYRGSAFYSYLDGLAVCHNKYIIHIDSDMLIGGMPDSWLQDAVELLNSDKNYLVINPLAGPPADDAELKQKYLKRLGKHKFLFDKMSTRIFLIDMEKLKSHKIPLKKVRLSLRNIKWCIKNNFRWGTMGLEDLISIMMQKQGLFRVDTLGKNDTNTAFTLHPLIKPDHYIQAIPDLLKRIDANDIPDSQRGYYNINNDFFDFSKAQ
ncbi:MAG TPA: hypothetical protein VF939_14010 [Puia sp.]